MRSGIVGVLAALILAVAAQPALAGVGQTIVDKCGKGESFGGYTQAQYKEALNDISTGGAEYSACEELIRKAELAAVGGGTGTEAGNATARPAIPLTPVERKAVQSAHKRGSEPVTVGSEPIRPGVVHADVASALSTLPHSLFAVLALLLAAAAALLVSEVSKRVRAGRDD